MHIPMRTLQEHGGSENRCEGPQEPCVFVFCAQAHALGCSAPVGDVREPQALQDVVHPTRTSVRPYRGYEAYR